jgi:hypothetical protein
VPKRTGTDELAPSSLGRRWEWGSALSATAAILLCLRSFAYPYLFDDFDFLERVQHFQLRLLIPDPALIFYRPVSRELYFGLLHLLSPDRAFLGHLINAALLASIILLTSGIAARLAGRRVGILAGMVAATFSQWPVLIGWISGAQDLFAIVLVLGSIYLALLGRTALAFVAMALALLAKETAAAAVPAVLATNLFRPHAKRKLAQDAVVLGLVLVSWAVIDPGVRLLLHRGVATSDGYIGLNNPDRGVALTNSLLTLVNLPVRLPSSWPSYLTVALTLATLPLVGAFVSWRLASSSDTWGQTEWRKVVLFGALLSVPPLLLSALLVRNWVPYYVCFGVPGFAIAMAAWLSTKGEAVVAGVVAALLVSGVWCRGVEPKGKTSERTLVSAATALTQVERNFKALQSRLPRNAIVYVTTMAKGSQSVYVHLHRFQALRVWYNEPTLQTLRPELLVLSSEPEFLFVVTPDLNVTQVSLEDLSPRSARGSIAHEYVRSALRSYAIGLGGVGKLDRAVQILGHLDPAGDVNWNINRRIAAMIFSANGDVGSAASMVRNVPDLSVERAIQVVGLLLTVPTRGIHYDEHAMMAFGLSPDDPLVLETLLRGLMTLGYFETAERIAGRLLTVKHDAPEALDALRRIHDRGVGGDQAAEPVNGLGVPGQY